MSACLMGCGDSGGRVRVGGNVALDGRPLEKGTVAFIGADGSTAGVGIVQNGSFEIQQTANASGIPPGTYGVRVESWEVEPGAVLEDGTFAPGESAIPEKYTLSETSGLTAEVTESGGDFTFDLRSSG